MKRILLIDDDQDLAFLTKSVLIQAGYGVSVANTVNEGLSMAKMNTFDLFLMDIMMPEANGGEVLSRIKKEARYAQTPAIFLSGLVNHERSLKGEYIVVDGKSYQALGKPYEVSDLLNLVKKHVS